MMERSLGPTSPENRETNAADPLERKHVLEDPETISRDGIQMVPGIGLFHEDSFRFPALIY